MIGVESPCPGFGDHPSIVNVPAYDACPKCGHEPLPADQRLPAACPACGVILAKVAALQTAAPLVAVPEAESQDDLRTRALRAVLHVPERVDPATFWSRCILLALFAIWSVMLISLDYRTGEMMGSFLHGPLLVFHEAGHVIFSVLGEFVMVLGGSLLQLLLPAVLAGALLLRNRDPFGASLGLWFIGVSLLDLAPYIYDALDPQLILLGGHTGADGGHDWIYLLDATGLLGRAHGLGAFTYLCGAVLIVTSLGWGAVSLWRQKARLDG